MLLAIDTSAGSGVAVVDETGLVRAERATDDTMRHAEAIGVLIAEALAAAGVDAADVDGVVAGVGPGPFTGLRVGIAAAHAFAFGAGCRMLPVVSHDALALAWYLEGGDGPLLVVTDARRRERYWSSYEGLDLHGLPVRAGGPGLAKPHALPETAGTRLDAHHVSAASLGMVAARTLAAGIAFAPDEPLYLRSPDVTPAAAPKRVSA
ncbi:tRNA (adenosine(37)-N6)-threonylcarbamoyltransferase complex dimerization subunit type 1 TsaB [Agromyces rhizosphaerae]|uniref:tRNA (Adenosine(37)-N6)-threonylcarbamoyltransferase complex dimerization subunit type 1 TsaB n=1 Tax=Agromyces rhizosphaerae TaxID=88374 RepID=A0A9W6CZD2_9MICO|nr:tRNA (adenosine(37)-N6)-threonylcarbamoyltransferase complex dimerization subunit type 1 TsaB [Agromyces rhizosphaerae]GLI27997.1 tRNA (adenosine(37)-N6)-threonylcarbamoyltransferase complex dimerization subunit type 1 TsaB [Agromyces rhizosphaerae]